MKTNEKVSMATSHAWNLWQLYNISSDGGRMCHLWYNDFSGRNDSFTIARKAKYELN